MSLTILHRRRLQYASSVENGKPIEETTLIDDPALRAYYQFKGNGNDYFGNYNAITANNVGYNAAGKFGRSATFNKLNSSYFRLPDAVTYNLTQTIVFWASITEEGFLYAKGSDSSDGWGMLLEVAGTTLKQYMVGVHTNGANYPFQSSTSPDIDLLNFNHYCIVCDFEAKQFILHLNGLAIKVIPMTTGVFKLRGTTDVFIGATKHTTSIQNFITGEISDWALFERRLTISEIQHLALGNPIA